MKTLGEIYQIVEESGHETAFNKGEVEGLLKTLFSIDKPKILVEIGVEFGRSTSVFAEFQKGSAIKTSFFAVDNFSYPNLGADRFHVKAQMEKHNWKYVLIERDSQEYAEIFDLPIDLIHIDGDHSYEGVKKDCQSWLPKVRPGGYACFDDYGHPGLDGVKQAVDEYVGKTGEWDFIKLWGNKLAVFRKHE